MSKLKIWSNGTDCIIAESKEQAEIILQEISGPLDAYDLEGDGWFAYGDNDIFTFAEETDTPPYIITKNKKAKEWCKEVGKPSYFASTEW